MKWVASAFVSVGLVASAAASFDMLLVSNYNTRQIHRYDAQNNVYLGAFDSIGNPSSMVVNAATSEVYVLTDGFSGQGIARYNIFTGEFNGLVAIPASFGLVSHLARGNGNELLLSAQLDVYRMNPLTGATIGTPLFYSDRRFSYPSRTGYLSEGNYLLYGNSDGSVWANDFLMAISPSGLWQGSWMAPNPQASSFTRDLVVRGNEALTLTQTPTTWQLHRHLRTSSVAFSGTLVADFDATRAMRTVEFGHGANGYLTFRNTSTGIHGVRAFGTQLGNLGPERNMAFTSEITGTAIFLAPEPGTMAALGLGVVALLRRRKRTTTSPR